MPNRPNRSGSPWLKPAAVLAAVLALGAIAAATDYRLFETPGGPGVTMIVLSGLSWDRVEPLRESVGLPALEAIFSGKNPYGDLVCRGAESGLSVLASICTGRSPRHHGIAAPKDARRGPKAPMRSIWDAMADGGAGSVVAGFPINFSKLSGKVFFLGAPEGNAGDSRDIEALLAQALSADELLAETALRAANETGARHCFLYLSAPRKLEDLLDSQMLSRHEEKFLLERCYREADNLLGKLRRARPGNVFIVLSEDGSAKNGCDRMTDSASRGEQNVKGFFTVAGPGIAPGLRPVRVNAVDVAPTLLYLSHAPPDAANEGFIDYRWVDESQFFLRPPGNE